MTKKLADDWEFVLQEVADKYLELHQFAKNIETKLKEAQRDLRLSAEEMKMLADGGPVADLA